MDQLVRPPHGLAWLIGVTAGEGLESGGEAFAVALAAAGFMPSTQRDFPSRIRGGDTTSTVRLTPQGHLCPPAAIDLALAFNATVLPRIDAKMSPQGLLLVDEGVADFVPPSGCQVATFPFTALAAEAGNKRAKNMVALGASAALMALDVERLQAAVADRFAGKGEDVVSTNAAALAAGFAEATKRMAAQALVTFQPPAPQPETEALFMTGNQAACLGALAAGCRIAAAYPITPASDILEYLTPRLIAEGGIAIQVEDEIAALNIVAGAGFAGARALTATSGPGLSLMTETIGLAGSNEVPAVIINCQRPGPSTGMPTKHGQEDLWHMVHGGHGEFPRVVLAPTDVADAFEATSEAFRLSSRFRVPAFVALDAQCSLFKQTIAPPDVHAEAEAHGQRARPDAKPAWDGGRPYGGDGVPDPGEAGIYISNSTEHGPTGFTNEAPAVRNAMVERRKQILSDLGNACRRPLATEQPDDASALTTVNLVSWGSTVEACREARVRLAQAGIQARVIGVRLLWPFPRGPFSEAIGPGPILVAEANGTGQLARLIRSELPVHDRVHEVLRYDGTPVLSDDLLDAVEDLIATSEATP